MNNFQHRKAASSAGFTHPSKWIPVVLLTAVILGSYYGYVVELCLFAIANPMKKIMLLIFFHIICLLLLWSYWNTIFAPLGTVPSSWSIPEAEMEHLFRTENVENQGRILQHCARDLPVKTITLNGFVRFCNICKIIKPDRAQHCNACGTCVLKMDHHCPWINNCVNFTNYKFFVLFLGYALLYCLYVALTSFEYLIQFLGSMLNSNVVGFHILLLFIASLIFTISLVNLFGHHMYLLLMNRTTMELSRAPIFPIRGADKNGFNLGKLANFKEVFGDNWKLWLLPIYTSMGDGQKYPTLKHQQRDQYNDTTNRFETEFLGIQINNVTMQPAMTLVQLEVSPAENAVDITKGISHRAVNGCVVIAMENFNENNTKEQDVQAGGL